tara:strand:- start:462 stop:632 length:171 start_codon:yes stop_codon:yes gene_type:complete
MDKNNTLTNIKNLRKTKLIIEKTETPEKIPQNIDEFLKILACWTIEEFYLSKKGNK